MQRSFLHDGYAVGAGCVSPTAVAPNGGNKWATVIPVVGLLRWYFSLQITVSASACRLSTTASGAMARCTLTSLKLQLLCTINKKPSPSQPNQHKQTTRGEGRQSSQVVLRCDRPIMGLPCWPLFFGGGRKTHRQYDQSISTLIHIKEPPVVGLPRWQSWQCNLTY